MCRLYKLLFVAAAAARLTSPIAVMLKACCCKLLTIEFVYVVTKQSVLQPQQS